LFLLLHTHSCFISLPNRTSTAVNTVKQSTCERIFRRDVQILERFAEKLRALNGFTQELPLLLDALLELCNISVPISITIFLYFGQRQSQIDRYL
jgi:hypothetical protein